MLHFIDYNFFGIIYFYIIPLISIFFVSELEKDSQENQMSSKEKSLRVNSEVLMVLME